MSHEKIIVDTWESRYKKLNDEKASLHEEIKRLYDRCDSFTLENTNLKDELKSAKHKLEVLSNSIKNRNIDIINLENDLSKKELEIRELRVYKRFYEDFHYAVMK